MYVYYRTVTDTAIRRHNPPSSAGHIHIHTPCSNPYTISTISTSVWQHTVLGWYRSGWADWLNLIQALQAATQRLNSYITELEGKVDQLQKTK